MIKRVEISRKTQKELRTLPVNVAKKLRAWVDDVQVRGVEEVRKIPGYHDEPLKGTRQGQRSIRLNKAYRAIYEIHKDGSVEFISIEEVNKHEY